MNDQPIGDKKEKMKPDKQPSLEDLLSKITPENIHPEIDFGKNEGKE